MNRVSRTFFSCFPLVFTLIPVLSFAQPCAPLRGCIPSQPGVTIGPAGETFQTFTTPDGGAVTYGPPGHRWRTFPTPDGGAVTYDQQGRSWRVFPGPGDVPSVPPRR